MPGPNDKDTAGGQPALGLTNAMESALAELQALAVEKYGADNDAPPPTPELSREELAPEQPDDLFAGMGEDEIDEEEVKARAIAHATERARKIASGGELDMLRNQVKHLRARVEDEEQRAARAERIAEISKNDLKSTRARFSKVAERENEANAMVQRLRLELPQKTSHDLLKKMLPALDSLDSVLKHLLSSETIGDDTKRVVEILEKDWKRTFANLQLSSFDAVGQKFDPVVHSAISEVETDEITPGTCVRQTGRGYLLEHRLLRPAQVVVSKALAEDAE